MAGLALVVGTSGLGNAPITRENGVRGAAALARLEGLPVPAQGVISSTLGASGKVFRAHAVPGGYALGGGGVRAVVGARSVRLGAVGGTLTMHLSGVGRGARLHGFSAEMASAAANRVSVLGGGVRSWYAAGPLGVEQGFTVSRRPTGAVGRLTVALGLAGELRARVVGSKVDFISSSGAVVLRYGGLQAVDASGRRLAAALVLRGHRLLIRVVDRSARYPVRIDPFVQQGPKLTPSDGSAGQLFGYSVALSSDGNTALIGAPEWDGGLGAAWVFTRSGSTWSQQGPKILAFGGSGPWLFGLSVALSADGNTALIGAPSERLRAPVTTGGMPPIAGMAITLGRLRPAVP